MEPAHFLEKTCRKKIVISIQASELACLHAEDSLNAVMKLANGRPIDEWSIWIRLGV